MAAVDRRLGMIRRGTTPAAPKPINLPSQKLENQGLVPDVEIVPRGTFCWGRAGRSSAASGKNDERIDSALAQSESNKTVDNGSDIENDLGLLGSDEGANPSCPVEISTLSTLFPACVAPVETTSVSSSFGANDANLDKSPAASDAGSLSGSSGFESCMSPLATPVMVNNTWGSAAKVEGQKQRKGSPVVCEGSEDVSNIESKQGTCGGSESLPGCQDFGYFEGFYNNNHPVFSPRMPYSNGPGMACGPGLHSEPSQHDGFYSFLGVPYYDSTKDKEIVVITMVGNPGFHGNYFPPPSLPDQYGRPTMFGNFPLQFGHFAASGQNILHGRDPMSAEMNSMCSGEQGEFVCYEQGYYEDTWLNGSSIRDVQRGNGAFWPTSFPMCKNIPKRAGRQKSTYRNKKAAPKEALSAAALKPERRVTLLTKVSQHEVIISSLQKTSKPDGNELAGGFSAAPSLDENFMEAPLCDPQCETAITGTSNTERIYEIVDIEKSHVSDVSRSPSAQEMVLQQATCPGSKNVVSSLLLSHDKSCLESKAEESVCESSSTTISTSEDSLKKDRPTCEAERVNLNVNGYTMNAAELPQDSPPYDSTESVSLIEQANEQVNREETLCTAAVALLLHKYNQGLPNQKSDMKWRRKGAVDMANLRQEHLNSKTQEAVVDNKASSLPSPNDKTIASANSSPNEYVISNAMSQCNIPLSSCIPASLSASGGSTASNEKLDAAGALNCAVLDSASKAKKSRKIHKAIFGNVDLDSVAESRPVQNLESSNKLPIKTLPFAEGHILNLKSAPCGFGKEWRPKLPGAGHGKSATKASSHQASKTTLTIKVSELQEVSCDDGHANKFKQQQQDEGRGTVSCMVDGQQTAKMMSSTHDTGKNLNNLAEKEQNVECNSIETVPLRYSRVEQRENAEKLIREQKSLQQVPLVSKSDGSNCTCRQNMSKNYDSFEACMSHSNSLDNHLGVDHQVSKVPKTNNLSSTTQMQTQEKSTEMEESFYLSQKSVDQPMLATQPRKPKDLNREVNNSSKAAVGLRQQSPATVDKKQKQRQLPVKKVPQGYAGPGHIMEKTQHSGLVARSVPNFASWGGWKIDSPLDTFNCERYNQNYGYPQEAHMDLIKQSMHRWHQQKVWCCKVMRSQEQQPSAMTCSSLTKPCEAKPCEERHTFSGGKPGAEKKKHVSFLRGASRVSWKPKQMSSVQVSKEKCKEGGNENPLSSASQKERAQGQCLLIEYSGNTPSSSAYENEQQASLKLIPQMKETSDMCPIRSCSNAPPSPSCGSGQQVENRSNQGLMKPASQSGMACEELPAAMPSSSCENGQHFSGMDKEDSLKHDSQVRMGPEECSIATSSSSTAMFTPRRNWQQNGDTGKQSCKAVLEKEHSAVIQKVTPSVEQAIFGPTSQPVSVVSMSLRLEDAPLTRRMKPHRNSTSWRRKTVSVGSIAVTSGFSKEVNENDPLACTFAEGATKKHIKPLPVNIFAASNDLHAWKNNGRHPGRVSYGLPYWRKEYPQLQKPLNHQVKFHTDGAFSLELLDRANTICLDGESARASKSVSMNEMKHTKFSSSGLHPVSKWKLSQQHVYTVKQAHFTSKQHTIVSDRRPFSTKSNFSHDDNKKIVHYQQPLSHTCLPMEQGYHRPFFRKSNLLYDDNKRAVHHQKFVSHAPKYTKQIKICENSYVRGLGHVKSLDQSRSTIKPARHGPLYHGRKFADSDKKGWVVKTETRCGAC